MSINIQLEPSTSGQNVPSKRKIMVWSDSKDELLCREILLCEPFKYKARTKERGNIWKRIASNLNSIDGENFIVDQRAVRERYSLISEKFDRKMKDQEKASGIAPPPLTELEKALEEIIARMNDAPTDDSSHDDDKLSEKKKAEDIRQKALETFAQTSKRKSLDFENESPSPKGSKKQRSSGTDTLAYLREKSMNDQKLREEELELRRKRQVLMENQKQATLAQQRDLMETIRESMRQQQQQSQQMMLLIAQMVQNMKKN